MSRIFVLFLLLLIIGCNTDDGATQPQDQNPIEVYRQNDVAYGTHAQQTMDIYLPANRTHQTKVVIMLHGGGWVTGNKTDITEFFEDLIARYPDYAYINMNYRLADFENPILPNQTDDIQSAIDYLESNSLQISNDYMLMGISAGGHLAMHYAYQKNNRDIKAVCNIVGPVDFSDPFYVNNPSFEFLTTYGVDSSILTNDWTPASYMSVTNHVDAQDAPTISFYGSTDNIVPTSQKTYLDDALQSHNVTNYSYIFTGGHGDLSSQPDFFYSRYTPFLENHF